MSYTCDYIGGSNCGGSFDGEPAAASSVHIHTTTGPHRWARRFQCWECYARDQVSRKEAELNGQEEWRRRRLVLNYSMGQVANAAAVGVAEYSMYESCRRRASAGVTERVMEFLWSART